MIRKVQFMYAVEELIQSLESLKEFDREKDSLYRDSRTIEVFLDRHYPRMVQMGVKTDRYVIELDLLMGLTKGQMKNLRGWLEMEIMNEIDAIHNPNTTNTKDPLKLESESIINYVMSSVKRS